MATLVDALNDPAKKPAIIEDCLTLIDAEVKDKKGMGGMAVKAGYGAVKGIKPGFIRNVVESLMPEFAEALAPMHDEATSKGEPVSSYLVANSGRAADALLEVTDGKAEKSTNGLVKKTYSKLRGSAKKNVEAAIPRLGALIEKHV
ncbi:MAG: hypothetical protein JJ863_08030 [Deltaproteobacteria bacterium]|nr:hypothetical protein [Deltaproteobacteria bacterium]